MERSRSSYDNAEMNSNRKFDHVQMHTRTACSVQRTRDILLAEIKMERESLGSQRKMRYNDYPTAGSPHYHPQQHVYIH
jgi:hypothetical protein